MSEETGEATQVVWALNYGADERHKGQNLLTRMNYIALGWSSIGDMTDKATEGIRQALADSGTRSNLLTHDTTIIDRFINEAQIGDVVVVSCKEDGKYGDTRIWIGTITGDYTYETKWDTHLHHLRSVKWCYDSLPGMFSSEARALLSTRGTFWRMPEATEFLTFYRQPSNLQK